MEEDRPYLLTIAGFDPSGGAGILADIKAFEYNKVYGQAVCTAVTFQNERQFEGVHWLSVEEIKKQADILFKEHQFEWGKIGLIENLTVLLDVIRFVKEKNPGIKLIWDPIIKASAGFEFHGHIDRDVLMQICEEVYLITPNLLEIKVLVPDKKPEEGASELNKFCNILLKGGHAEGRKAIDILYEQGNTYRFEAEKIDSFKHGTGCVLSAAILTNLAKGYELADACREGKEYVTDYLKSHESLLGYHYV